MNTKTMAYKKTNYIPPGQRTKFQASVYKFKDSYQLVILFLPCFIYFFMFVYAPMWGLSIAFMDYKPFLGMSGSNWVGFKHFIRFFSSTMTWTLIKNTFLLSFYSLIISFPFTIIFALIVNEIRQPRLKKGFQTITYMPHFISVVVIVGMLKQFLKIDGGLIFGVLRTFGFPRIDVFSFSKYFRILYISSGIWQGTGWAAIIYYAAFAGISPELYESAVIDGANKFRQIIYITLPSIMPTIITLFILNTGHLLSIGFDKAYLMQVATNISASEVISTFVYKNGLLGAQYSYGAAVGLFNSFVNLGFVALANYGAKKLTQTSLY